MAVNIKLDPTPVKEIMKCCQLFKTINECIHEWVIYMYKILDSSRGMIDNLIEIR
jgi:hypothetical protein